MTTVSAEPQPPLPPPPSVPATTPSPSPTPTPSAGGWTPPAWLAGSVAVHGTAAGVGVAVPALAPWALAAVVANHALVVGAGLWPRSRLLGPNVTRLPAAAAARGELAITIDDGPDPEVTPALLDLLAAHGENGIRATFFCIAERARQHPALVRRMVQAGHSVQNHSLVHRHNFSLLGPRALAAEVGGAQQLLADITGVRPFCFRAPAGLRNVWLDPVLRRLDLHLVSWTRRGFDTRTGDPARVLARLSHRLAGGDILLLHDANTRLAPSGRAVLLDVLPPLLQRCAAAGLRPVTLPDALPPRHAPKVG